MLLGRAGETGELGRGSTDFGNEDEAAADVGAGKGEGLGLGSAGSELSECGAGFGELGIDIGSLLGQEPTADAHQGKAVLGEGIQAGDRPGSGDIVLFSPGRVVACVLGTRVEGLDAGEAQGRCDAVQEAQALLNGVEQEHLQMGERNLEHQPGEPCSGADIHQPADRSQVEDLGTG